jgi:phospholipid transport system substrate-binding protein
MKSLLKFVVGFYLVVMAGFSMAAAHPAEVQMQQNAAAVMGVMNNKTLSADQKIARLEKYAEQYLDYERVAALSVGLPWREFSAQQKKDFIAAFQDMIISMYAKSGLIAGEGAQIKVLNKTQGTTKVSVFTEILTKKNQKFQVEYQMYKVGSVYKVYNIKVEGASLVTVYRNQFNEVIRKKGINGLIQDLRNKSIKKIDNI